jgi:phage shock protein C
MLYLPLICLFLLVGPAIAGIAFSRRLSTGWHLLLLGICVLYGISPFLVTWAAPSLAKRFGCSAEAIGFRCPSPAWMGDFIYGMTMSHWLAIFVVPSAILGAIGLLLSWILQYQRSRSSGGTSAQLPVIFCRSRRHKVIAGVCSALAQRWHQPVQLIRIVTVVLALFIPASIALYFWCWLAFPFDQQSQQPIPKQS